MKHLAVDTARGPVGAAQIGSGPVVVLIAGLGSTRRVWGDLPRVLARRFTVLSVDNRGVGGSRIGDPFSLEGAALDVLAAMDAGGHHEAGLLGVSMGGGIALSAALADPYRFRSIVVASCAARLTRHGRRSIELIRDILRHMPLDRVGAAIATLSFGPRFATRFPGFINRASDLYAIDPEDLPGAITQADRLLMGWDMRRELDELELPVLALCGARDPIVAPQDTAELAEHLPRCRSFRLDDAAHAVLAEGGADVMDRIVDFLTEPRL